MTAMNSKCSIKALERPCHHESCWDLLLRCSKGAQHCSRDADAESWHLRVLQKINKNWSWGGKESLVLNANQHV